MTINDIVRDYEAVASSPAELGAAFGDPDAVPQPYTLEQEIVELGWHQKEFQMGFSFVFIVVPLDEQTCLVVNRLRGQFCIPGARYWFLPLYRQLAPRILDYENRRIAAAIMA